MTVFMRLLAGFTYSGRHRHAFHESVGTTYAHRKPMPKINLLAAILVPALSFGGNQFAQAAEPSLDSSKTELASAGAPKAAAPTPARRVNFDGEPLLPIGEGPQTAADAAPAPVADSESGRTAAATAKDEIKFETTDIISASEQGIVQPTLTGNGRERMLATLRNNSPTPLRVKIPSGQVLEGGRNLVVVARPAEVELMPAQSVDVRLVTVALHSTNKIADSAFKLSYQTAPKLDSFLEWVALHPEVSTQALQTAALALSENLPLNSLSKFAPANGITSKLDTEAFRAETGDLIGALSALQDSGVKLASVDLSLDPQLRIEAMIEPLSREAAKRFYGITEEREWDFWKHELLNGDPGTRHYALFGIARFYPQVAIEMLPKWAREIKTHPVYRMAAVQALAETQLPEAMPVLHALATELGATTELGKAATQAAQYLDTRLTERARTASVVAFRGKNSVNGF